MICWVIELEGDYFSAFPFRILTIKIGAVISEKSLFTLYQVKSSYDILCAFNLISEILSLIRIRSLVIIINIRNENAEK